MLIRLLRSQIDPHPALRKQMVSALILGGNVQVPTGKTVGGSFEHIPTCCSPRATGCVIAYSIVRDVAPGDVRLRPSRARGQPPIGSDRLERRTGGLRQPGDVLGRKGALQPYFLSAGTSVPGVTVTTPWVSFPGLYTAQCKSRGGATWLEINATSASGDPRPIVTASLGPDWGYHADDVNLALGNLVRTWRRRKPAGAAERLVRDRCGINGPCPEPGRRLRRWPR